MIKCVIQQQLSNLNKPVKSRFSKELPKNYFHDKLCDLKQGKYENVQDFTHKIKTLND